MNELLTGAVPALPLRFFAEISAIPRASLHEEQIADYLVRFAAEHGLWCYRDASHNVLIRKSGSAGRESEPPLLLQAHTDMVAEVRFGRVHDFLREGVTLVREGNILHADGTTLGADNGLGVALMLAVLARDDLSHPPLECLFTAAEEIGLVGAAAFDYTQVRARRMINFDAADERMIITGCCGGIRSDLTVPCTWERADAKGLHLTLTGLCGGHSGEDIHSGRANALAVMGKILAALRGVTDFRLSWLSGGDKTNAIPRSCEAILLPRDLSAAEQVLIAQASALEALAPSPKDAARTLAVVREPITRVMSQRDTDAALAVLAARNGVFYWKEEGKLPDTSRNLARVRTEDGALAFAFSSRSPRDARLEECVADLDALAARVGGVTRHYARYPGWESAADSPLSRAWQDAWHATTGRDIGRTVIHAGLECGIIASRLAGLDVISVGSNAHDLHTPRECAELDSFARVYDTLCACLGQM
ncbi:MAG: beta-Ala-His dipeptidase [Clostridia bacterium]|nr:beta-Ala-His dipeptidase [Clostridia bacterium]